MVARDVLLPWGLPRRKNRVWGVRVALAVGSYQEGVSGGMVMLQGHWGRKVEMTPDYLRLQDLRK